MSKTTKAPISLLAPLSSLDRDAAAMSIDVSVDVSRNPRLVGLYLAASKLAMVRREFLLQHATCLPVCACLIRGVQLTWRAEGRPR